MSRTKRQKRRRRYPQVAVPPEVHERILGLKGRLGYGVPLWGVIARGLEALEEKLNGRE